MKTNILYFILFLWMALTSFWGCADHFEEITPDEPEAVTPENPGVNVKNTTLLFDASGVALGINLRAVGSGWKAYPGEECPWLLKISPEEGDAGNSVIGVTLTSNESMEERSTFMYIEHLESGDTVRVNIKQYTHESKYTRESDSVSLVAIYHALSQNEEWVTPWELRQPITTWAGLEFEEIRGEQRVVGINTRDYKISGNLPNELGNLRELKRLIITGGSISQNVPTTITSLRKLEEIKITYKEGSASWDIPEIVSNMKSLRILDVAYLKIAPAFFKNLYKVQSLETIRLQSFDGALPEGISELANLKELSLGYTGLSSLPQDFGNLANLEILNLSSCIKLTSLGENLGQLTKLQSLNLSYVNKITALPESIGQLQSLTSLNLSACSALESLPESLANLKGLTTLRLYGCSKLKQLPSQLGNLKELADFDLTNCTSLTSLPESFGNLTKLTKLQLTWCSALTTLPQSFGSLSNLSELVMTSCDGLTSLPESFGSLTNLKKFTLTTNSLVPLPSSFGNLTSLEELSCTKYGATGGISGDISMFRNMSQLKILKANYNKLSGDLSVLSQLPNLTTIELGSNQFSGTLDLSRMLTNKLVSIDLSNNGLSGTLAGITQGTALTKLALNKNKITGTLPANIDLCSKLTTLDLSDNLITGNLPVALINMNFGFGGLKLMRNNMSGVIAPEILSSPAWKKWSPNSYIIPQNPGYGFSGY